MQNTARYSEYAILVPADELFEGLLVSALSAPDEFAIVRRGRLNSALAGGCGVGMSLSFLGKTGRNCTGRTT